MPNIIESFIKVGPYINKLTNRDFTVTVSDLEKYLLYIPSEKQNHDFKAGDMIFKDSIIYECISSGQRVFRKVGPEVYGFPYIGISMPIKDEKEEIVGAVAFTEVVDKENLLLALADNLQESIQQLVSITQLIATKSDIDDKMEINNYINSLIDDIEERLERLRENTIILNEEC